VRIKKRSKRITHSFLSEDGAISFIFYGMIVLVAFCPSLFGGKAYFEADLINFSIPAWDFIRSSLGNGHWPLWCPYILGGQPFTADPNCMVFYPLAYLYLLPSRAVGSGLFYGLHLFLALLGMHLWLKSLGFSRGACRLGAVIFGLSGFFWCEIIHPPVLTGYTWLPWWGFGLEGLLQTWKRRWAFVCGLFLALLFLSGHFQVLLGAIYGGAIYFFFRVFSLYRNQLQAKVSWKNAVPLGAAFLWGAVPLMALAIPFFEFSGYSGRVHQAFDYFHFNADLSDNPRMFFKYLFPSPSWSQGQYSFSYLNILEDAGYLGVWFPFLLFFAYRNTRRSSWVWFWSGCAVLGLLLTLGRYTPLHRWLCQEVLGFEFVRAPYRFVYLYTVAGVFLAVLGWEFLETRKSKDLQRPELWVLFYASALSGMAVCFFAGQAPAVTGLLFGAAGFGVWFRGGKKAPVGEWIFIMALAFSMILSGWRTCSSRLGPESNFDFTRNLPELSGLKQKTGLGRAFIDESIPYPIQVDGKVLIAKLPQDTACAIGLRNLQGYNPLSLWKTSQLFSLPFGSAARLFAVQVIAKGNGNPFMPAGFKQGKLGSFCLCYAPTPYPFVYAPERFEVVASDERRLVLMGQKDFNPYRLSYFSDPPPPGAPAEDLSFPNSLSYRLTRDDPDEEVFQVQKGKSGWTVFSEVVYPGWKAWVDAKPAVLLTANHVFRTVFVPAGDHEVRFSYEPVWWTPIRIGLVLWVLSVLGLFFRPFRQRVLGK
jgi:hypothetical protein